MSNRKKAKLDLPAWTVSRGQTYLNEKVYGEDRDDLKPLRDKVADTSPSDGTLELNQDEYQTFQRVVRDGAERELQQLEGREATIMGDAGEQREVAREARDGIVNNPPTFEETPRRSPDSGFFTAAPTQPTDIGREADGEFARPESSPNIEPAPIDRDRKTGEFGIDPFDMTAGGGLLDPSNAGGMDESREIEFGGEQVDLTERDTDELEQMNSFLSRNIDAEVDAQRAKGGFGTSDFAQDYSEKQTEVALELDRRG